MQSLAFYLLKVIACSGILLLYYRFALRNKRFHYYNRFYLLATVAASILLPLLNINWFTINSSNDKAIALMSVMYVQGNDGAVQSGASHFAINWQQAPVIIYSFVSILFIGVLAWRINKIYAFKKKYSATSMGEFDFINTDLAQAPFSFLQNLFWRSDIDLNETTGRQILQHELTHIRQKHTWDKICIQLVLAVFWINPFYWFIQKELWLLHEFIADEKAIENNDGAAFATMLLTSQYGRNIFSPAQPFAYSPIKRRLFMLTNLARPRYSYLRRLMVLPLLASVILLFAFRLQSKNTIAVQDVQLAEITAAPFKIIIDAGHGGDDNGLSANGINEKDISLNIAKRIKDRCTKYGVEVVLTRTGDFNFPEHDRINIASSKGADAFISLHMDDKKEDGSNQGGFNAFVSKDNTHFAESKLLGSAVLQNLATSFKASPSLKERQQGLPILNNNPLPAILLQCGNMGNAGDLKNATDDAKVTAIADDILQGIANYANHTTTASHELQKDVVYAGFSPKLPHDTTPTVEVTSKHITITYRNDSTRTPINAVVILDGKEVPSSTLNTLDPNNIESVYVLKGADAINKYGAKATDGVIEIYTKGSNAAPVFVKGIKLQYLRPVHDSEITVTGYPSAPKPITLTLKQVRDTGITITGYPAPIKAQTLTLKPVRDSEITVIGYPSARRGTVTLKRGDVTLHSDSVVIVEGHPLVENLTVAEVRPASFPGGAGGWQQYLRDNVNADIVAKKGGPPGRYTVIVSFFVDEEGNVSGVKAMNDPGYGTAAEAERVMQKGPKWAPAKQNGVATKSIQKQSISFVVAE